MRISRDENGSALIITLMVLLALTVIGTATVFYAGQHNEIAVATRAQDQTLFYADAGVNWGEIWIKNNGMSAATAGITQTVGLLDNAGGNVQFNGSAGTATNAAFTVTIGPSFDSKGKAALCGVVGFGSYANWGLPRFQVLSNATGPLGARRAVEAHIFLRPTPGVCGGGLNVNGYYAGSGT